MLIIIAFCGLCTGVSGVMMEGWPADGFKTIFSIDYTDLISTKVRVSMYMLSPPKTEADFTRIAKQYIGSTIGNGFSDTLGSDYKGRKATHVEVIGVYENEILVMSRKIGDKETSFNKYTPIAGLGWYDKEGRIETLPPELARHLIPVTPQQTPVMTYTPVTRTPTSTQTRPTISAPTTRVSTPAT